MQNLHNFLRKYQKHIFLLFVSLLFLLLTIPSLFSDKHILYNLEPYPDGLFYTLSAKNLIDSGKLSLEYHGFNSHISQPPVYALILSIGYFIWNSPEAFYAVNISLVLLTILVVSTIIFKNSKNMFINIWTLLFFITHAFLYWIPTTPMTENAAILFVSLSIYILIKEKFSTKEFLLLGFISLLLTLTRLSMTPTSIVLILIGFFRIFSKTNKSTKRILIAIVLIALFFLNYLFSYFLNRSLFGYLQYFIAHTFSIEQTSPFYNISYFVGNTKSYFLTLLGKQSNYLWLNKPLTSIWIILAIILNSLSNIEINKSIKKVVPLILIFLSQFTLLLSFYLTDSRYIVYSIIILPLIFMFTAPKNSSLLYKFVISIFIVLHLSTQLPLFKQVVSENILHRSVAWQYEATKVIDEFSKNQPDAKLITALPPHLVVAYVENQITLLPLSEHQEFIAKGEKVWGSDIGYENLLEYYSLELTEGSDIYITNAYVTHQHSVIEDYENYKEKFSLELVEEWCLGACNIYMLKIK